MNLIYCPKCEDMIDVEPAYPKYRRCFCKTSGGKVSLSGMEFFIFGEAIPLMVEGGSWAVAIERRKELLRRKVFDKPVKFQVLMLPNTGNVHWYSEEAIDKNIILD